MSGYILLCWDWTGSCSESACWVDSSESPFGMDSLVSLWAAHSFSVVGLPSWPTSDDE